MKRFLRNITLLLLPIVVVYAYPVYLFRTGAFFGDVYLLSGKAFDASYQRMFTYDPGFSRHVTITEDYPAVACDSSVLVLGDSFSQIGRRTFTEYLQNMMPGWTVYNVQTGFYVNSWIYLHRSQQSKGGQLKIFKSMTDYVVYMLESAETLPNTIVMETSELFLVERLAATRYNINDDSLENFVEGGEAFLVEDMNGVQFETSSAKTFIAGIEQDLRNAQRWMKKNIGINRHGLSMTLRRDLFDCKGDETMLYFGEASLYTYTTEEFMLAVKNMRTMLELAEKRGVNLIFFFAPDKMQLYRKYGVEVNARFLNNSAIDDLEKVISETGTEEDSLHYQFNKKLLLSHIDRGEKDVFLCNDSHWTYKASEITARELRDRILKLNEKRDKKI